MHYAASECERCTVYSALPQRIAQTLMQHRHLYIAPSATAVLPALVPDRLIENMLVIMTVLLSVLGLVLLILT